MVASSGFAVAAAPAAARPTELRSPGAAPAAGCNACNACDACDAGPSAGVRMAAVGGGAIGAVAPRVRRAPTPEPKTVAPVSQDAGLPRTRVTGVDGKRGVRRGVKRGVKRGGDREESM